MPPLETQRNVVHIVHAAKDEARSSVSPLYDLILLIAGLGDDLFPRWNRGFIDQMMGITRGSTRSRREGEVRGLD